MDRELEQGSAPPKLPLGWVGGFASVVCTGFGSQQCFSHSEVPNSTPALTLVYVRCPFLRSQEQEHTVSQPAEQDGGVVQLRVLGLLSCFIFCANSLQVYYTCGAGLSWNHQVVWPPFSNLVLQVSQHGSSTFSGMEQCPFCIKSLGS